MCGRSLKEEKEERKPGTLQINHPRDAVRDEHITVLVNVADAGREDHPSVSTVRSVSPLLLWQALETKKIETKGRKLINLWTFSISLPSPDCGGCDRESRGERKRKSGGEREKIRRRFSKRPLDASQKVTMYGEFSPIVFNFLGKT